MPDDVSARVMAAVTAQRAEGAERAERGTVTAESRAVTTLDTAGDRRSRRQRLRPALAAAAAVAVIAGLGAVGVSVLRDSGLGSQTSTDVTTSGGGSESSRGGPAGAPAAPAQPAPPAESSTAVVASGRAYTRTNLAASAAQLVTLAQTDALAAGGSARPSQRVPGLAGGSGPTELRGLRDPVVLAGCVGTLTPRRQAAPLAVDLATYDGHPAAIIVVPSAMPDEVDVYVVGPDCSASGSDLIASTTTRR